MKRLFNFNIFIARERRIFLILLLLLMVLFCINFSLPLFVKKKVFDYSEFEQQIEDYKNAHNSMLVAASIDLPIPAFDINAVTSTELEQYGLPKSVADRWAKYRDAIGGFKTLEQVQKIYGLDAKWFDLHLDKLKVEVITEEVFNEKPEQAPVTFFPFDPNTVTEDELEALGFTQQAKKALINFRKKGGNIYTTEELKSIYGVDAAFFDKISSYIRIDSSFLPHGENDVKEQLEEIEVERFTAPIAKMTVDINQSNVYQWQMLKGIGANYAARIIRYRESLGGFVSVDQVAETYNMPDSVFRAIKPFLTVSAINRPIAINRISVDSLRFHPYIDWKQASIIVNYRSQHGPYQTAEDLLKTRVFDTAFVKRIEPYLEF